MSNNIFVYDLEVFPNYLLISFMDADTQQFTDFEYFGTTAQQDIKPLRSFLTAIETLIGFNTLFYDNEVVQDFLKNCTVTAAKSRSDSIINNKDKEQKKYRRAVHLAKNDVDVLGVLDKKAGLKLFECRLGLANVLECGEPFDKPLAAVSIEAVKKYCHNDIVATWELWRHRVTQDKYKIKSHIAKLYEQDLASSTESEIGSAVITSEIRKRLKLDPYAKMQSYCKPCLQFFGRDIIQPTIKFKTPMLKNLLAEAEAQRFSYGFSNSKNKFKAVINIGGLRINFAKGGLHSKRKPVIITTLKPGEAILDFDVASYYPTIVLQEKIAPTGLENAFLEAYQEMVTKRLAAKKAGDKATANCYKIVLNSTYGKFGDKYSWLYNPKNMMAVTLNCQLRLLQLIEDMTEANIEILQVNTDGILTYPKSEIEQSTVRNLVKAWELENKFQMEETSYSKILMNDVNNYIAQYAGKTSYKDKGRFLSERSFFGGGTHPLIITKAMIAWYFNQTPIESTIAAAIAENNILDFCRFSKRKAWNPTISGLQKETNRWIWGKDVVNILEATRKKDEDEETEDDFENEENEVAEIKTTFVDENILLTNDLAAVTKDQLDIARYIQAAQDWVDAIAEGVRVGAIAKRRDKAKREVEKASVKAVKEAEKAAVNAAKVSAKASAKAKKEKAASPLFTDDLSSDVSSATAPEPATTSATLAYSDQDFKGDVILQQLAQHHAIVPQIGKKPCLNDWAVMPKDEINQITAKHTGNFALRLDQDVMVMDVDISAEKAMTDWQREAIAKLIPETTIVFRNDLGRTKALTSRGHFYFRKSAQTKDHINFCLPGQTTAIIEIRSKREAITIPPSLHPDDHNRYQWHNVELLLNVGLPEFPLDLFAFLNTQFPPPTPPKTKTKSGKLSKKTQADLDAINGQLTIESLLDMYDVEIDSSSGNFRCLFHAEWQLTEAGKVRFIKGDVNPSASYDDQDTHKFFCHTCQESGDVIDLYRKITGTDFKTAVKELKDQIAKQERQQAILASIPAEAPEVATTIAADLQPLREIKKEIATLSAKTIMLFGGGTGAGKSHTCCEATIEQARAGNDVVYICVTIKEARRRVGKLCTLLTKHGLPSNWLSLITSKSSKKEEESEGDEATKTAPVYSKILVTTAGYFGRKGHYACGYQQFRKMIEGRIVICDEVQELWQKMQVFLPLQARYLLLGGGGDGNYNRMLKCPKTGKKGDCRTCTLATLRKRPDGQTSERSFYYDFAEAALAEHLKKPDLYFSTWEPLHDSSKFEPIDGTLFSQPIIMAEPPEALEEDLSQKSYIEFLRHLLQYLHNPHIRTEYPIDQKTQEPIAIDALLPLFAEGEKAQLKGVRFPVMACGIPTIAGIDLFGPMQFFGGAVKFATSKGGGEKVYQGAKAIVMTSATIPNGLVQVMDDLAVKNGWKLIQRTIADVPFRFDVTLLKTSKSISEDKLAKLVIELDKTRGEQGFIVCARKSDSDRLKSHLDDFIPEKISYFHGREFEQELKTGADKKESQKYYLTYARSAISRDEDFPEVCVMVVDCQQFRPMAALANLHPLLTPAEKRAILLADVEEAITQILGRPLRSKLNRIENQVVDDPRKIVVLLHGLPEGLSDLQIDPRLIHHAQDIRETFYDGTVASLQDSCERCLDGDTPQDWQELARVKLIEKAKTDGIESLGKEQRELLTVSDKQVIAACRKPQVVVIDWEAKIKSLPITTKWRDFDRDNHLSRLNKSERINIKKIFYKHIPDKE